MSVLLINLATTQRKLLVNSLIQGGIETFSADDPDHANYYMNSTQFGYIVIDINHLRINWLDYLNSLTTHTHFGKIKIMVKTKDRTKATLMSLIKIGISQLYVENSGDNDFLFRVESFVGLHGNQEKRKYLRVNLEKDEKALLNFTIRKFDESLINGYYDVYIEADIRDISTVAVAFYCKDPNSVHYYSEGKVIEGANFYFNRKRGSTALKILKSGEISIANFVNQTEEFKNMISEFIFDKLSKKNLISKLR